MRELAEYAGISLLVLTIALVAGQCSPGGFDLMVLAEQGNCSCEEVK